MFPSKKPLSIFFFFNDGTTHPQSFDDFRRLAKRHPLLWHSVTSFPSSPLHSVVQRRQQQHTRQIESTHSSQASNNGLRHARSRNVRAFLCFLLFRRCIFFFPFPFFLFALYPVVPFLHDVFPSTCFARLRSLFRRVPGDSLKTLLFTRFDNASRERRKALRWYHQQRVENTLFPPSSQLSTRQRGIEMIWNDRYRGVSAF